MKLGSVALGLAVVNVPDEFPALSRIVPGVKYTLERAEQRYLSQINLIHFQEQIVAEIVDSDRCVARLILLERHDERRIVSSCHIDAQCRLQMKKSL